MSDELLARIEALEKRVQALEERNIPFIERWKRVYDKMDETIAQMRSEGRSTEEIEQWQTEYLYVEQQRLGLGGDDE